MYGCMAVICRLRLNMFIWCHSDNAYDIEIICVSEKKFYLISYYNIRALAQSNDFFG